MRVSLRTAITGCSLASLVLSMAVFGVEGSPRRATAQASSDVVHYRRLRVETPWGEQRVLVSYPRRSDRRPHPRGERYPLLIALHGRGEALQGPDRGFLGWSVRYGLAAAFEALGRQRLRAGDYQGFVRPPHLTYVNESLRRAPFRGLMVVNPYVPDIGAAPPDGEQVREYVRWLAGPLLESVRERFPGAARTREGTGIDGVSLGGRIALLAGFAHPDAFGAVGATQPAIRGEERALAERALGAASTGAQHLRLLTSDDDPFAHATETLSRELRSRTLRHTFSRVPGPHDYAFNRGPGALEMLLFHDRALAREALTER